MPRPPNLKDKPLTNSRPLLSAPVATGEEMTLASNFIVTTNNFFEHMLCELQTASST